MLHWLRNLLCGILIGAGAILPGVSGGVLAVIFDIYRPFMEVLTHPRKALPKYIHWAIPLGLGCCTGFLLFAKGICVLLDTSDAVAVWLFIGLIIGTLPSLFREAGHQGRPPLAWVSFTLCFGAVFFSLYYMSHVVEMRVEPDFWWYCFCGMLWGIGVIVPGMATSSVLMAMDLYQPLMDGLSRLDIPILASTLPGMLLTIALLARLVSWFFRKHYALAWHGMLGIVLASTLVIIPTDYTGVAEIVLSVVCCIGGFLLAFLMARLNHYKEKNPEPVEK